MRRDAGRACEHPMDLHGLCVLCGASVDDSPQRPQLTKSPRIEVTHDISLGLWATEEESHRLHQEMLQDLLQGRRLSLVIDLDQTILHATVDPHVLSMLPANNADAHDWQTGIVTLPLANSGTHYVKFRPGLCDFLSACQAMFEMHVYTMGSREYAVQVCAVVDPTGRYFGERILSREDAVGHALRGKKSLRRLFPHGDRYAVVVDDRGDVWDWCDNLLLIEPYVYFLPSAEENAREEYVIQRIRALNFDDSDEALSQTLHRLKTLHRRFFFASAPAMADDVKVLARQLKQQVLSQCQLCFTGLPKDQVEGPQWWRLVAESFGAFISERITDSTTHLIAAANNTSKVYEADQRGIPIVSPQWLLCSTQSWRLLDPLDFAVPPAPRSQTPPSIAWVRSSIDQRILDEIAGELIDEDEGATDTVDTSDVIDTSDTIDADATDEEDDQEDREPPLKKSRQEKNGDVEPEQLDRTSSVSSDFMQDLIDDLDELSDDDQEAQKS